MSMINDYTVQRLSTQRQQDLAAEAANRRLVRLARCGRPTWWQQLQGAVDHWTPRRLGLVRPAAADLTTTSCDPAV